MDAVTSPIPWGCGAIVTYECCYVTNTVRLWRYSDVWMLLRHQYREVAPLQSRMDAVTSPVPWGRTVIVTYGCCYVTNTVRSHRYSDVWMLLRHQYREVVPLQWRMDAVTSTIPWGRTATVTYGCCYVTNTVRSYSYSEGYVFKFVTSNTHTIVHCVMCVGSALNTREFLNNCYFQGHEVDACLYRLRYLYFAISPAVNYNPVNMYVLEMPSRPYVAHALPWRAQDIQFVSHYIIENL